MGKSEIKSTWLNLNKETAETGKIPSHITGETQTFLRILQEETSRSRTTFPTNLLRTYISNTKFIFSQVPFNLYKESTPTSNYECGNTELLLNALRTRTPYSVNLRHFTNRVALCTNDGICYADAYESFIPKDRYSLFNASNQLICDGMITNTPKITLIGYAADCILVKLEDQETGAIGVLHAGWKNLIGKGEQSPNCKPNIVEEIIYRMGVEFGVEAKNIQATIYPCISTETFKVGPDVAIAFDKAGLGESIIEESELWEYYIDLRKATSKLLNNNGVKNIAIIPFTTDHACFNSMRLSRKAIKTIDYKMLSSLEYNQKSGHPSEQNGIGNINPQNLLIVKKF